MDRKSSIKTWLALASAWREFLAHSQFMDQYFGYPPPRSRLNAEMQQYLREDLGIDVEAENLRMAREPRRDYRQ